MKIVQKWPVQRRHSLRLVGLFGCLFFVAMWFGCPSPPPPPQENPQQDGGGGGDIIADGTTDTTPPPSCTSDADCTDPSKPKCINGVCDAVPTGCGSDADCTDPSLPTCLNGVCVSTCGCQSDADCPSDHTCQSCQCVPNPAECTTDDQCKAGFKCVSGKCVSAPSSCTSDADCTNNPAGSKCDTSDGTCVGCLTGPDCPNGMTCQARKCVPITPGCKTDADCKDPNAPVCVNGTCTGASPECKTDADCKDPTNPKCTNGTCGPGAGCNSDADCNDPNNPKCIGGQCGPECKTDGDCTDPTKRKCTNGACTAECATDKDCTDPNRPICQSGTCTPKGGCKSDADCAPVSSGKYCELSTGKCVLCLRDSQCQSHELCDTKTYTCILKPGACYTDKQCAGTAAPYCVKNACVVCRADTDCKRLESCLGGVCKATGCTGDADCANDPAGKYCNPTSKQCVTCTQNAHCPTGSFCDTATSTCKKKPACTADSDCKAPVPYCDATSKTCVACTSDTQCKKDPNAAGNARCVSGACAGCTADKDCKLGYLCKANTCVAGCNTNRDCPTSARICHQSLKKCVECLSNTDCSGNDICDLQTNTCSYRCTNANNYDSGCVQRGLPRYCDGTTRTCVDCVPVPFSSSSNIDRGCNTQLPKCNTTTRTCVLCRQDSDCPLGPGATKATCDAAKGACIECKTQNDCRRGYVCNAQSGKCITGCLTDNDCPRGQVCGDANRCTDCSTKSPNNCPNGLVCRVKDGLCVACLKDTDCKTGEKCDTTLNLCLGGSGRPQCAPCAKDSECSTGHTCVKTKVDYQGTVNETVCLKSCRSNSDCGQGYTCCSASNSYCNSRTYPERNGKCYPTYLRAGSTREGYATYNSCKALFTQGQSCQVSGYATTCGHGPIGSGTAARGDSLCESGTSVCRLPCRSNNECTTGYTCQCPAGTTQRTNSYYCYSGNTYFGPTRCIK